MNKNNFTVKEISYLKHKVAEDIERQQELMRKQDLNTDDGMKTHHNCEVDIKALEDIDMKLSW